MLHHPSAKPAGQKTAILGFFGLCLVAYGCAVAGSMVFPGQRPEVQLGRAFLTAIGVLLLLFGSKRLLGRAGFFPDALGLKLTPSHAKWFFWGLVEAALLVALIAAVLALKVPFHWEKGQLPVADALLEAHGYFWNNLGEELIFRGFALVVLSHWIGSRRAVLLLAVPFGLFHLPGMGLGLAALKMFATTAAMSVLFSYSFLLSNTLWTAVGLHVMGNVLLHTVTGLDGAGKPTMWKPVFDGAWPTGYDAGFWTLMVVVGLLALVLLTAFSSPSSKRSLSKA